MYSVKPGRGPSGMGALGGIFGVCFGIFWTCMAYSGTRHAPGAIGIFFPLFGVMFVIMGIVNVIYNLSNATKKDRYSVMDITTDREEPDPLNQAFGKTARVEDRLKEVDQLLSKGVISQAEHASQRERILREI